MRNKDINAERSVSVVVRLVLCVAMLGAASWVPNTAAAADDKSKNAVSKEIVKPLKAAQDLVTEKKYPEAIEQLKQAEAFAKKTPYDEHIINEIAAMAYLRSGDHLAEAEKAFEALVDDGLTEASEMPIRLKGLAQLNYQLKDYNKAVQYGERAIKEGHEDDDIDVIVGQAYYVKNDYQGSIKFQQDLFDREVKAGRTPSEQSLKLWVSSCANLKDSVCTINALQKTVAYYPTHESWQQLLYSIAQDKAANQSDRITLQLYRLMSEVDVMQGPGDYLEMAQIALAQGSPGEAQHILEKGNQKGLFSDTRNKDASQRLMQSAKEAAATDQASLPKIEKDADAAPLGDKDVGVGFAYLGYGQYDKASSLLEKGLKKGGVKSEPEARLLLGIAQLKAGHKDEAVQTFQAVKGDPTLERLATLWSLRAKQA